MSAAEAQAEPTMEEILASIRRIISEDEAPASEDSGDSEILDLGDPIIEEAAPEVVASDFDFDALDIGDPEPIIEDISVPEPEPEISFEIEEPEAQELSVEDDEIIFVDKEPEPEPEPYFEPPAPIFEAPEPAPPPVQQNYEPRTFGELPPQLAKTVGLVGQEAADAAASAFAKVGPMLPHHFANGVSVEELVAHMLKPMLKEWLDANLPRIVEERVEAELARIARRGF